MNNIDNPLSDYQPPSKEAMVNYGIYVSDCSCDKLYTVEIDDSAIITHLKACARDSKIIEETRRHFDENDQQNRNRQQRWHFKGLHRRRTP